MDGTSESCIAPRQFNMDMTTVPLGANTNTFCDVVCGFPTIVECFPCHFVACFLQENFESITNKSNVFQGKIFAFNASFVLHIFTSIRQTGHGIIMSGEYMNKHSFAKFQPVTT